MPEAQQHLFLRVKGIHDRSCEEKDVRSFNIQIAGFTLNGGLRCRYTIAASTLHEIASCARPQKHTRQQKDSTERLCSFCQSMTAKHAMYVLYRKFINTRIYATNKCLQRNEGMTGVHSRAPYARKQAVKAEAKHQKKTPHSRQWFQHTCLQVDCNLDHRTALGFGEALSCCATSHLKATCPA